MEAAAAAADTDDDDVGDGLDDDDDDDDDAIFSSPASPEAPLPSSKQTRNGGMALGSSTEMTSWVSSRRNSTGTALMGKDDAK